MGKTITQDGQRDTFTAVYRQHGARCEEPCDSLNDAVGALVGGFEHNTLSVEAVLGPDGDVVLNADQVFDLIGKDDAAREQALTRWVGPRHVGAGGDGG